MPEILIIDDDPHIRDVVCFALEQADYTVRQAANGRQGLELFHYKAPDLIILDIMMPEMEGTEVCREIRKTSAVPILFLSAKDDEIDRIVGLELGGDDYVAKPFSPRELVARVRAILRRAEANAIGAQAQSNGNVLSHGRLMIDLDEFRAWWDGQEVVLTVTEFGIIRTLLQRPGKVFTRDNLMDQAYDLHRIVSDRTIDSHVRRVRAKFASVGAEPVETVHGLGYKLGACD
jgi:two-component system OmpR family response regulator